VHRKLQPLHWFLACRYRIYHWSPSERTSNLDDEFIAKLKLRAERNQRSMEAEHREILQQALGSGPRGSFKEIAAKLRAMTAGRRHTPSENLLREGREER
jgi:antitoxin FitA